MGAVQSTQTMQCRIRRPCGVECWGSRELGVPSAGGPECCSAAWHPGGCNSTDQAAQCCQPASQPEPASQPHLQHEPDLALDPLGELGAVEAHPPLLLRLFGGAPAQDGQQRGLQQGVQEEGSGSGGSGE